jgi:predicted ArsR family transcriptional regulator
MGRSNIVKICEALSVESRANLLEHIYKKNKGASIEELSKVFRLHPNVIRTHLDKLQEVGIIESYEEKVGQGRPRKIYKKSKKGISIQYPQRRYELLSSLLLEIIKDSFDKSRIEKVGEEFGRNLIKKYLLDKKISKINLNTLWNAVSEIFGGWGLMPKLVEITQDSVRWDAKNCIYYELALQHEDIVCFLHESIIRGMTKELNLNCTVEMPKTYPKGYEGCYVVVEK